MRHSLPRRGAGLSTTMATITPTDAAAACCVPQKKCTITVTKNSPSATSNPLSTWWLSRLRLKVRQLFSEEKWAMSGLLQYQVFYANKSILARVSSYLKCSI